MLLVFVEFFSHIMIGVRDHCAKCQFLHGNVHLSRFHVARIDEFDQMVCAFKITNIIHPTVNHDMISIEDDKLGQ